MSLQKKKVKKQKAVMEEINKKAVRPIENSKMAEVPPYQSSA